MPYDAYRKSKDKAAFLSEHRTEIALFEAAKKQLDSMKTDGKLPTMKMLKSEKVLLTAQKNQMYEEYSDLKAQICKLETVTKNIFTLLYEKNMYKFKNPRIENVTKSLNLNFLLLLNISIYIICKTILN